MIFKKFPKSLKSRLILYFLLITIVPSVMISYFYFKNSQDTLEKNMIDTSQGSLDYTMTIIDKQLKNAEQISDWIFMNRNLDSILNKNRNSEGNWYNSDIRIFLDLMDYQLRFNSSVNTYIYSLIIHGKKGLDIRAGQPEGTQVDIDDLERKDWFQEGLKFQGKKFWYGVVENPSTMKYEKFILPLVRPIIHSITMREIGWQYIGFRTSLISDLFKNYEIRPDETLIVIDSQGYCIFHNEPQYIGQDLKKIGFIRAIKDQKYKGNFNHRISGAKRIVIYSRSQLTGWMIVKILSSSELNRQKKILLNITAVILLSSFFLTSFLTVYLSSNLTQPLTNLLQQTKAIAAGNFERVPSIEGEDELGALGYGVNEMAVNIRNLLDRVIEDEQEKRRLELEVLQNQINPHFLYNTLNSVKLMATIQKADGIKEIVSALGRLLMNLSKNSADKIALEEELSLLNDYIYIQNIRYKGKIKVDYQIDNETYLQCKIIKFTLQPIVENAIFHGIEPKKDAGQIRIRISEMETSPLVIKPRLLISVEDDGVGMTPDQIEAILNEYPQSQARGLSKIGIKNVNERIKLVYGPEYGLTIESVVGKYTKVLLTIPLETD